MAGTAYALLWLPQTTALGGSSYDIDMRLLQGLLIVVLVFFVLLGADMAFDARFVPLSALSNKPLFVIIIYGPTVIFGILVLVQLFRHRLWPTAAFTAGLLGTGFVHQWVAEESYGNPGYMFPIAHMAAPVVSMVAYLTSFLAVWVILKISRPKIRALHEEDHNSVFGIPKDDESA